MVPQRTVLPSEKDRFMKFTQWGKKLKVPFVIYADFECILSPLAKEGVKNTHTQTLWILLPYCECCR